MAKMANKLMIKIVVCKCGKEWQLWRGNLGLREEHYSFHCICGERLFHGHVNSALKAESQLREKEIKTKVAR
jgi:hypothetical protein